MPPRLSTFPLDKPFEKQPPTSEFSKFVLRLLVGFDTASPYIVGTATIVSGHLAITARHNLEEVLKNEGASWYAKPFIENSLTAVQILPGSQYQLWEVVQAWGCPQTDLAFLQFASAPHHSGEQPQLGWKHPSIYAFPPDVGSTIAGFGYRKSSIKTSKNADGGFHYDLKDEHMASVGVVREILERGRDKFSLPFPCYQVSARFDGGMSGGPVIDETGAMCGLRCSGFEGAHDEGEPIS